ncbi:hypothetical protein A6779_18170 [Marinobacter adhaerens]|nr:hypothetical protein A6779_18170 [Marinobacter adhaerens]
MLFIAFPLSVAVNGYASFFSLQYRLPLKNIQIFLIDACKTIDIIKRIRIIEEALKSPSD